MPENISADFKDRLLRFLNNSENRVLILILKMTVVDNLTQSVIGQNLGKFVGTTKWGRSNVSRQVQSIHEQLDLPRVGQSSTILKGWCDKHQHLITEAYNKAIKASSNFTPAEPLILEPLNLEKEFSWHNICSQILVQNGKDRLTTSAFVPLVPMTLEGMHVPLGLVKREKPEPNRPKRDIEPEQGSELYREHKEQERIVPIKYDEFIEAVLKAEKPTAVIGEPGAGKTTLLQKIASAVLDRKPDALVVWVDLAALGDQTLKDYIRNNWLTDAVDAAETDIKIFTEDFNQQRLAGNIWLLLDGVDEMEATVSPLVKIAKDLQPTWFAGVKVVLTCRLNVWDQDKNALNHFQVYRNLDFEPEQVNEFIDRWFGSINNPDAGKSLKQNLQATGKERIRNLIRNPLRLTLLCIAWFRGEGDKRLPETKAGVYEILVKGHYHWKKNDTSNKFDISPEKKNALHKALGNLAKVGIAANTSRFRFRESIVEEHLGNNFEVACDLGWLNRIGRANKDEEYSGEEVYAFIHPTFQEYFAARAINDSDFFLPRNHQGSPIKDYTYRIFDKRWREVVLLWLGRSDINEKQKKEFLGVDAPTGLAQFIEGFGGSGDGCNNFYSWKAIFWLILATSEVYHLDSFKKWSEQRIITGVILTFGKFDDKQQRWQESRYPKPIIHNARETLKQINIFLVKECLFEILDYHSKVETKTKFEVAILLWEIADDQISKELSINTLLNILQNNDPYNDKALRCEAANFLWKAANDQDFKTIILLSDQELKSIIVYTLIELLDDIHNIHIWTYDDVLENLEQIANDPDEVYLLINKTTISTFIHLLTSTIYHLNPSEILVIIEKIANHKKGKSLVINTLNELILSENVSEKTLSKAKVLLERIDLITQGKSESLNNILKEVSSDRVTEYINISTIIQTIQNESNDVYLRIKQATTLAEITSDQITISLAINVLLDVMKNRTNSFNYPQVLWTAKASLEKILKNMSLPILQSVVTSLRESIHNRNESMFYELLCSCSQNMPYLEFYAAWHHPSNSHFDF